eukprot:GFUD01017639.1.p1 GENE.GFUD01017639.1~~GFUD01017639.1.p1  ORF type:complete len:619 (-),score=181.80 GFUD01017639.1:307-2163(-)
MKCVIPEIAYHNRDPVLSVDFQITEGGPVRLATAGSDTHVVIWSVTQSDEDGVELDCLCDLTRHQRAVNIVRWSPDGSLLASGDDESVIIVWQLKPGQGDGGLFDDGSENKENWVVYKMLRFHLDDVYDLSWSPCGQFLLSGSVDNSAVISNVHKNSKVAHFSDSRGFVQGVSWNKKHNILSTLGSDRACRSYNTNSKKIISKTYKSVLNLKDETVVKKKKDVKPSEVEDSTKPSETKPVNKEEEKKEETKEPTKEKEVRLFHDETFKGFFRRLSWSNDGEILVVPSGVIETDGDTKVTHCSWVFSRVDLSKPALCLPTKDKYTIAVRFAPKLYALRPLKQSPPPPESSSPPTPWTAANSLFALPYRMVYAVATQNAIMFYDTQQAAPFGRVSNVHYTGLTDLTWSPCGTIVFASSSDGYCSIITFSAGEIGVEYTPPTPSVTKEDSTPNKLPTPFTSQPAPTTTTTSSLPTSGLNSEGVLSPAQVHIKSTKEGGKSNPKRLQFITLSSPKAEKKMSKLQIKDIESDKVDAEDNLGVERMETEADDLCLVLEETQPEAPVLSAPPPCDQTAKPAKKRVPLTTIATGPNHPPGVQAATPEKAKGRRVNLITLSSPKPKS